MKGKKKAIWMKKVMGVNGEKGEAEATSPTFFNLLAQKKVNNNTAAKRSTSKNGGSHDFIQGTRGYSCRISHCSTRSLDNTRPR